jgi:uncharacterized protein (DUF1919 family)
LVGDLSFAIVSNNCWGAHIYQALDLPYSTPFVGLFVPPVSYLQLLRNFDELMAEAVDFTNSSTDPRLNKWRQRCDLDYPIGLLGGQVELHFLHYKNPAEAKHKWERRTARMPADPARRFFKFDDREGVTAQDIAAFCALPLQHKVCFTANAFNVSTVRAPAEPGQIHVLDGLSLARVSRRTFNTVRWISSRPCCLPLPSLI